MTQPLITTEQIDNDSLFPVGSGHQMQSVFGTIVPSNGTSQIPYDNTSPLITEGTEFGTSPFTRIHMTSSVLVQFNITVDSNAVSTTVIIAIFRNDVCIASGIVELGNQNPQSFSMTHIDVTPGVGSPAFADPITYSGRIGTAAGTEVWHVNSTDVGNDLGGQLHSTFVLTEVK